MYEVWRAQQAGEAELAQAEQNRQIAIAQAKAKAESAHFEADAEVTRATGVAQANETIGKSLQGNEAYLRSQSSPHSGFANMPLKALACATAFANAAMSGASRCSGMLGINS